MQPRAAIEGDFRGRGLDGRLSLTADAGDAKEVMIRGLQLKAAGGVIDADLRVDRRTLLARGKIEAKLPDLSPWSRVAGVPLAGRLDATAGLDVRAGQGAELKATGERLAYGGGESRIALGRLEVTARLDDLLGTPYGKARAILTGAGLARGGAVERDGNARQPEAGPLRVPRRGQGQRGRGADSGGRRHRGVRAADRRGRAARHATRRGARAGPVPAERAARDRAAGR